MVPINGVVQYIHKSSNTPDPKGKPLEEIRKIRDEIDLKVRELVSNLKDEY